MHVFSGLPTASKLLTFAAIVFVCASLSSCITLFKLATAHTTNVSGKRHLWGEFQQGQEYLLLKNTFLEKKQDWSAFPILATISGEGESGQMEWLAPKTIEEWHQNKEAWKEVIGVVESGTRLRMSGIRKWSGGWLYPVAEILDGEFAGREVNIFELTRDVGSADGLDLLGPEPQLLKLVQSGGPEKPQ